MKDRIRLIIKEFNITQKKFAELVELQPTTISDFLNGRFKTLSSDTIENIYRIFHINPIWLLVGEGEMFVSVSPSDNFNLKEIKVIQAYRERVEIQPAIDKLLDIKEESDIVRVKKEVHVAEEPLAKNLTSLNIVAEHKILYKIEPPEFPEIKIPNLGRIAAGFPFPPSQSEAGLFISVNAERLPKGINKDNLFALEVSGMSMKDAGILDGETIVLEKVISVRDQIKNGDIVAALIDGEATLKYAFFVDNMLELRPGNPDFKSIFLTEKDFVAIQGKLIMTLWGSFKSANV